MKRIKWIGLMVCQLTIFSGVLMGQDAGKWPNTDWPAYGNDAGGMRFSPLQQVNERNVSGLKLAWTFRTGELATYEGTDAKDRAAFEATPIKIGRTLYFSTPSDRVFAIDAGTGRQIWVFDPGVDLHKGYSEISSRGVTAWPGAGGKTTLAAARIVFVATIDGRLIALDPDSGQRILGFGKNGEVDLRAGLGEIGETSPPAVIGDLVILGSSMGDNQRLDYPPGVIRAYDVHTGALRWTWNPIPGLQDSARRTWKGINGEKTGGANAWSVLSTDADRDLVFIPTTSPSPDYYGGERTGSNMYANSLVALRASTGKLVWHFQVVHHDLWDFDIAAQPVLIEVMHGGRNVAAVAVGTKMGHVFVLDRETGVSLFLYTEKSVAASTVPGEEAAPTQPIPVLPAPLGLQGLSKADAWGPTPADREEAEKRIGQYRYQGPFTPPSYEGSIMAPGNVGGIHWGGMCYDPQRQLLITNINRVAAIIRMLPRDKVGQLEREDDAVMRAETGRQNGTPYVMKRDYLFKVDPRRGVVMQTRPPWGTLLAIDLRTGRKKWEVPLGYMLDTLQFPGAQHWGSLNFGGAIVTAGNLVFVAATRDGHLRAFNRETGAVCWEYQLPAGGQATPMTYSVDGKQYVLIAAGGHGKLKTPLGDYVVAFALP